MAILPSSIVILQKTGQQKKREKVPGSPFIALWLGHQCLSIIAGIEVPQEDVSRIRESLLDQFLTPEQLETQGKKPQNGAEAQPSNQESKASNSATSENESEGVLNKDASEGKLPENKDETLQEDESKSPETSANETQNEAETEEKKDEYKKVKVASIDALLKARQDLIAMIKSKTKRAFDVSLQGVDTGQIEAVIKARQSQVKYFNRWFSSLHPLGISWIIEGNKKRDTVCMTSIWIYFKSNFFPID